MIKDITDINDLMMEVQRDKESIIPSDQRYPMRPVFVNKFTTFKNLVIELRKSVDSFIDISLKLPYLDGWFTSGDIINLFLEVRSSACIFPISEYLRFTSNDVFNTILITIFELENLTDRPNNRIYLPMLGLWERFQNEFYDKFHRKNESGRIWKINEPYDTKIMIYHIDFPIKTNQELIQNTRDWLGLWKKNPTNNIFSSSKSLGCLYKRFLPDQIFQSDEITNYKKYIKICFNLDIPIHYHEKDQSYWIRLTSELENQREKNYNNFRSFIIQYLNLNITSDVDSLKLVTNYLEETDKFKHWLLRAFLLECLQYNESYLSIVLNEVIEYTNEEIIGLLWIMIFKAKISDNQLKERKKLLEYIHHVLLFPCFNVENALVSLLKNIENLIFSEQVKYLTDITNVEKKHIMNQLTNFNDLDAKIQIIESVYPELYHYLSWDCLLDEGEEISWIVTYFREYCLSKAVDYPTDKLLSLLNEKNSDSTNFYNWYYKVGEYPDFNKGEVIWIDGLGAEWMSLLVHFINKYGKSYNYNITKATIVRINLPSITDVNRHLDATYIGSLDKYIHDENPYSYPISLIAQIDLLKKMIIENIIATGKPKIVIVSDHGFTFLAQKKYGNFKKFNLKDADHDGRCMWTNKYLNSDSDFILHNKIKDAKQTMCLLSLKHSSMDKTPYREVHGGATPEEVLVPYIEIEIKTLKTDYMISIITKELSVSDPKLSILISPNPAKIPYIEIKRKNYQFIRLENSWYTELVGISPGDYNVKIIVDETIIEDKIRIKGGIVEEELF